jgi:hypothetical protein
MTQTAATADADANANAAAFATGSTHLLLQLLGLRRATRRCPPAAAPPPALQAHSSCLRSHAVGSVPEIPTLALALEGLQRGDGMDGMDGMDGGARGAVTNNDEAKQQQSKKVSSQAGKAG